MVWAALWGLRALYKSGVRYEKIGILLLDLAPTESVQASPFLLGSLRRTLMPAIDAITRRYGRGQVPIASTIIDPAWKLRAEFQPGCTTKWDELLSV